MSLVTYNNKQAYSLLQNVTVEWHKVFALFSGGYIKLQTQNNSLVFRLEFTYILINTVYMRSLYEHCFM
jgi:hypothetical protein